MGTRVSSEFDSRSPPTKCFLLVPLLSESGSIAETGRWDDNLTPGVLGLRVMDGNGIWSPVFQALVWSYDSYPILDTLNEKHANFSWVKKTLAKDKEELSRLWLGRSHRSGHNISRFLDPVKFNLRVQDYLGVWEAFRDLGLASRAHEGANPISSLDGDLEDLFRSQVTWYEQDLPAVLSPKMAMARTPRSKDHLAFRRVFERRAFGQRSCCGRMSW